MTEQLPLFQRAASHGDAIALRTEDNAWTYRDLLARSAQCAATLLAGNADLAEARVAVLAPAGFDNAVAQWGIWRAGGIAVPLSLSATEAELDYVLEDAQVGCVVTNCELAEKLQYLASKRATRLIQLNDTSHAAAVDLPLVERRRRAMILYTSGTTSRPKGVVTTHANIQAQIESLVEAWEWNAGDRIPLFLPLHHIHGIINVLACALWTGATIEPFAQFDMNKILARVAANAYTLFMAVPTIYVKLVQALEELPAEQRTHARDGFARMRLMVSGSAALPASLHQRWAELTGQTLLERYGMTEIGMALSNPYRGERRPGFVGVPLPDVEVRLVDESGGVIEGEDQPGEIQTRGPGVFAEYWNRPEATNASFLDAWFRTGDVATRQRGYYQILGRQSVDIIKSGGYKLSALEIEAAILQHPDVRECAVLGVADETWGEIVAVAAVVEPGKALAIDSLREWCRDQLSHYKLPKRLEVVETLPRNAMGKVTKPALRDLFE